MMVNSIQELHTDFLFVYGTLRRGFALHHHLVRMGAEFVADGVVQAELFDLGKFPGARKSTLIALKAANVSDRIVEVMLDPSKAERPAHIAPTPVAAEPEAAEAALPTEVGVYAKKQGQWVELSPEIVYWKTGGALKTIATAGILHGDVNGHVQGANSHTSFGTPLEFLIVAPEGTDLAEYQLVRLHSNKDNREFRTITGTKTYTSPGADWHEMITLP